MPFFVPLPWSSSVTEACLPKRAIFGGGGLPFRQHDLHLSNIASILVTFTDLRTSMFCDEVTPVDINGAKAVLMESLNQFHDYRSPMTLHHTGGWVVKTNAVPDAFVKSIECTVCLGKSVVHLFVNTGSRVL